MCESCEGKIIHVKLHDGVHPNDIIDVVGVSIASWCKYLTLYHGRFYCEYVYHKVSCELLIIRDEYIQQATKRDQYINKCINSSVINILPQHVDLHQRNLMRFV